MSTENITLLNILIQRIAAILIVSPRLKPFSVNEEEWSRVKWIHTHTHQTL